MAQVAAARRAERLGPTHEHRTIGLGRHGVRVGWCEEARPTRPRIEFRLGTEELRATAGTAIGALAVLIPQRAGECSFRALLAKDAVLLGSEGGAPFGVGARGGGRSGLRGRRSRIGVAHALTILARRVG